MVTNTTPKTPAKKKAVKKRIVQKKVQPVHKEPVVKTRKYFNNTPQNIFTVSGRVMPGEWIVLTTEESKDYPGLSEI